MLLMAGTGLCHPFASAQRADDGRPDIKPQTPNSKLQTPNFKLQTPNSKLQTSNFKLQTPPDSLRLLHRLPAAARYAVADHLGNSYLVTEANLVEKYAPDGRFLARYSSNRLGQVTALDVSNPLKVLVWYADFRSAALLDRSLTLLGEINLIALGYPDVRVAAAASDGNLWLYDEVNFRLLKITPEGEKRAESQSLNLLDYTPRQPLVLREQDNRVWLVDATAGLGVFNAFGQFERSQRLSQVAPDIQFTDNQVVYLSDSSIVAERWPLPQRAEIPLPAALRPLPKWLGLRRLFVRREGGVEVYGF